MSISTASFDVLVSSHGEEGYEGVRRSFARLVGNPPMTGITLPVPNRKRLSEGNFLVARYCLDRVLEGQTCILTDYEGIDIDLFFDGLAISGQEQLHLLAHLVLANLQGLTDQEQVYDRMFRDKEGAVLWFSAGFPPDLFRTRVASLRADLDALLKGEIQGRIAEAVFKWSPPTRWGSVISGLFLSGESATIIRLIMDRHAIIRGVEAKQLKTNTPDIRAGETVRVHYKIREGNKERVQVFEGLVIAVKRGRTLQGSFTVRKVVSGVGVERTFPLHSPWIVKIERLKSGKIRRSKLYFVRRHAQSPKRFRLKDKGVAGTIWEDVAKEQEAIAEGEEVIEQTEVAPADQATEEPVAETPETTEDKANDDTDKQANETDGEDAGSDAAGAQGAADSGAESTN